MTPLRGEARGASGGDPRHACSQIADRFRVEVNLRRGPWRPSGRLGPRKRQGDTSGSVCT